MAREAVQFDDEALRWPEAVDLEALDQDVHLRRWHAPRSAEGEESLLEDRSGYLECGIPLGQRVPKLAYTTPSASAAGDLDQGFPVEDTKALGLNEQGAQPAFGQ